METEKKTFKGILDYARELSVVVLGIAITFTVTHCISSRSEKRDMKLYLSAIKLELEENLKIIEEKQEYYKITNGFATYLLSGKDAAYYSDKFHATVGTVSYMATKTSAFEMFKSSGTMRLVQNKALLNSIWESYAVLESTKNGHNSYMDNKWEELLNHMLTKGQTSLELHDTDRLNTFLSINTGFSAELDKTADVIKHTVNLLE